MRAWCAGVLHEEYFVDFWVDTNVLEEHTVFIFGVEGPPKHRYPRTSKCTRRYTQADRQRQPQRREDLTPPPRAGALRLWPGTSLPLYFAEGGGGGPLEDLT